MRLYDAVGVSDGEIKSIVKQGLPAKVYRLFLNARFKFLQIAARDSNRAAPIWGWAWNDQGRFRCVQGREKTPEVPITAVKLIYVTRDYSQEPQLDVPSASVAHALLGCSDPIFATGKNATTDFQAVHAMVDDIKALAVASRLSFEKASVPGASDDAFRKYRALCDQDIVVNELVALYPSPEYKENDRKVWLPILIKRIIKKAQGLGIITKYTRKSTLDSIKAYILQSVDRSTREKKIPDGLEVAQWNCEDHADMILGLLHLITPDAIQRWLVELVTQLGFVVPESASVQSLNTKELAVTTGWKPLTVSDVISEAYAQGQIEDFSKTLLKLVKEGLFLGEHHLRLQQLRNVEHNAKTSHGSKFTTKGSKRQGTLEIQEAIQRWVKSHDEQPTPRDLLVARSFRIRKAGSGDIGGFYVSKSEQSKNLKYLEVNVADSLEAPNDGWISFEAFSKRVQRLTIQKRGRRKK